MNEQKRVAVVGSGPAGLMVAFRLAQKGFSVTVFEKRKGLGRKLLVAGSSGLNITYECPPAEFAAYYEAPAGHFAKLLAAFSPADWRAFIEKELGIPTFVGTSRRYFVEGMKASAMLKNWTEKLRALGVEFATGRELAGFEVLPAGVRLRFTDGDPCDVAGACLALGGGSWEPEETPLRWVEVLRAQGLEMREFRAANVGYELDWPAKLLAEAEGQPLKNVVLKTARGERRGELVITRYGLEGTPVYFAGCPGMAYLDFKPELDAMGVRKLLETKENLSVMRRIQKRLKLGAAGDALVFHLMPPEARADLGQAVACLKRFPLRLLRPRPLAEAISSSGGLAYAEVDDRLMLRRFPRIFVAGEMLDWHAPTGGFLIQGSVSQGAWVGDAIANFLA